MIVTQKIFDTIRNFQVDMSHLNIEVEEEKLRVDLFGNVNRIIKNYREILKIEQLWTTITK